MTSRWRAFLRGVATLDLWGTPAKRLPMPPIGDVLAADAAKVHVDFTRAFDALRGRVTDT